jgi:hypothetical protein
MFDTNITIDDNTIGDDFGSEVDNDSTSETSSSDSSTGPVTSDVLSQYIESAFEDGTLDRNELRGLNALTDAASTGDTGSTSNDSGTDETDSEDSSDLTPQDFMSELNDIADEEKGLTDGERKMLDEGQRMINATPEQQQAFLDKAKSLAEESGEIGDEQAAELSGFADGLLNDAAEDSTGTDGVDEGEEKPFMDKVEDLLAQSQGGDEGPGEKMAREAAEMLKDNPEADQQAFLDELDKMLNNTDGNGDYEQDVDETNDGEGTMLKNMAESFEGLRDTDGSSNGSTDSGSSSGGDSTISALLDHITTNSSDGGNEVTANEASALRALLDLPEESETETAG